ncbi:MAG: xanthine dehydrogenase family protein subunit M [Dehalococcoidia bacterium]
MRPFRLHEPTTVDEALSVLRQRGDSARLYAGGTELLLAMKAGFLEYDDLVNVKTIAGLDAITTDADGNLHIGPAATHSTLESSPVILERFPLLAEVEHRVANVRVRNVGTIGGNICFAEPHSDPATVFNLFGTDVEIAGPQGRRMVDIGDLQAGPYETAIGDDEMLTDIVVQPIPKGARSAYLKFGYHHRPTLGVGAALMLDGDGAVEDVRIAVGCVSPVAFRVREAENVIKGEKIADVLADDSSIAAEAGRIAAESADAVSDLHGTAEYKQHLVKVFVKRALAAAADAPEHGG